MSSSEENIVPIVSEVYEAAVDLLEAIKSRSPSLKALALTLVAKLNRLQKGQKHVRKPDVPRSDPKRDMKPLMAWWKEQGGKKEDEESWRVGWSANEGHGPTLPTTPDSII